MSEIRHPKVTVKLIGEDGNAFSIMGRVKRELQRSGVSRQEVDEFLKEAMSGDYDHLLQTVMNWVTIK